MGRGGDTKQNQTVDQEQQAHQGQSMGSKMIHLPVALFKAMMHHGKKQLDQNDEEAAAETLDDPQQQQQPAAPMPMTQAPAPMQPGLAPTPQYGPPQ